MAVFSALRRFAKLGFWIGLGAGAMLADACSSGLKGKAQDAAPEVPVLDAHAAKEDAPNSTDTASSGIDAGVAEVGNSSADGGQTDLWDIICE
jgi:hypothetical protein